MVHHILETVRDRAKILLITYRRSDLLPFGHWYTFSPP